MSPFSHTRSVIFVYLALTLLLLWAAGVHASSIARPLLLLSLLALAFRSHRTMVIELSNYQLIHLCFIFLWIALLLGYQFSATLLGTQGVDYAIFTDVFRSFAENLTLQTNLLDEHPKSFLTHHFSPILALPGTLALFGIPARFSGIIVHIVVVSIAIYVLYLFIRSLNITKSVALFGLMLLALNPSFRLGLSWEIHDETFGLAFVALSYYYWHKRQDRQASIALFLSLLCKETFFFYAMAFAFMVLLWEIHEKQPKYYRLIPYCTVAIIALFGAHYYIFSPPLFLEKTFNATGRIPASMYELLATKMLEDKFALIVRIFIPLIFLPFWTRRGLIAAIPAFAFLGPILVSNFANMYQPYNYYSVLPTFILSFSSFISLSSLPFSKEGRISPALYCAMIALPLCAGGPIRPMKSICKALREHHVKPVSFNSLPQKSAPLVTDEDLQFVLGRSSVFRTWTAERTEVPWTHFVIRNSKLSEAPTIFLDQSKICSEESEWQIRCKLLTSAADGV